MLGQKCYTPQGRSLGAYSTRYREPDGNVIELTQPN